MKDIYDVLIIGAGPIGLACAIEAGKNDFSYVLIDKGCLVNALYHYPLNMTFFSTSEKLEIGGVPFISHGPKPNRFEALEYYRRVAESLNINVKLYEEVIDFTRKKEHYVVLTNKRSYKCKAIIFATGFYDLPYLMNVPGENLPKVKHYYDEPHPYFRQKLIVVGAGNSAVDVALETWRKGADVTMIIREEEIGDNIKYWVRPDILNRIKEGKIKAWFRSEITEIRKTEVDIITPEGPETIENDYILAMTGYKPNYALLENAGIKIGNDPYRTPVHNTETMETNMPGIYLAGVICGGLKTNKWFIENSRVHAHQIITHISQ